MEAKFTRRNAVPRDSEVGQAMVEFVLVVVFLFVLFVSMLQLIFLMYAYTTLADAAKEGIRYAIVHGTGNSNCSGPGTTGPPPVTCHDNTNFVNVKKAVTNFAGLSFQNVTTGEVNVDYNPNGANGAACNVPGCMVRVTVQHRYTPLFGLPWPSVTLNAAANGRIMN